MNAHIFVVDDDKAVRSAILNRLARQAYRVHGFDSGESLLLHLRQELPDLILLDFKLPGISGLDVIAAIRQISHYPLIMILTAYGGVHDAVEATKLGAYDFLVKTVDMDGFDGAVRRALESTAMRARAFNGAEPEHERYAMTHLVAESKAMKHLLSELDEVAAGSRTTVLLQGETGTGKEFIARVLHYNGDRAQGAFIAVNCTAIPQDLFESELFGHEPGASTGSTHRKVGLLEQADHGTLFLDEIGDLDLTMQAKLLQVLQERFFRRLGSDQDCKVDFQLIAATNRDLKSDVVGGRFREDLFFRLNVVRLELPPLRHRVEDIIPLAFRALVRYGRESGKDVFEIDPAARRALERYAYPGNIRELENMIERAVIFSRGNTITLDALPEELHRVSDGMTVGMTTGETGMMRLEIPLEHLSLAKIEHAVIEEMLRSVRDNKTLAAKQLGITRFALSRKLKKWMIRRASGSSATGPTLRKMA